MTSPAGSSTAHMSGQAAQAVTVAPTSPLSRESIAQSRVREDDSSVINPYKRPKTAVNGGSQQRYASSGLNSAFSKPFTTLLASRPPARPASSPWSESGHRVHPPLAPYRPPSRATSSAAEPDNGGPAFTQYWGSTGPEVFRKLTSYCDAQIQAILQANWEQMARLQRETQAKLEGKERVCQRRIEEKTDIWRSREMKLVQVIRSQVKMIDQLRAQLDDGDSILVVDKRRLTKCVREAVALCYQQAVDACSSMPALSGGIGSNEIATVNEDPPQGGASREQTSAGASDVEARGLLPSSPKPPFVPAKLFDKERFSAPGTHVERSKNAEQTGYNEINLPDWVEQSVFTERVASEKRPATPVSMGHDGSTAIVLSPCSSPGVNPLSHSSFTPAQTAPASGHDVAQTHSPRLERWVAEYTHSEGVHDAAPPAPLPKRPAPPPVKAKFGVPSYRPLYTHQPLDQQALIPLVSPLYKSQPRSPRQHQPQPPSQPPPSRRSAHSQAQPRYLPQPALPGPARPTLPPSDPFRIVQRHQWSSQQSQQGQIPLVPRPSPSRTSTPQKHTEEPSAQPVDLNNAMYIRSGPAYPAHQPVVHQAPLYSATPTPRQPNAPPAPR